MIEAGYRCAICKETSGLEIDHIVEWAEVRKHEFNNIIVLCAVCHARKTDTNNPRQSTASAYNRSSQG
jgi:5-methylcytosine-specific restriction endonuclease McrA